MAESLFGEYNPGGKLPLTFPRTVGQIPLAVPHRSGAWGGQNQPAEVPGHWVYKLDPKSGKLEAIAFNAFDSDLGPALGNHGGARFHVAGRLELNHWNGRVTPQLRVEDAAPA